MDGEYFPANGSTNFLASFVSILQMLHPYDRTVIRLDTLDVFERMQHEGGLPLGRPEKII